jgi:hypothetical protein
MKWIVIGACALLLAFLAATKLFGIPPEESRQMASDRAMIEKCRNAENDPLQELADRRLMRQGCDQMVKDYREKWGVNP